MTNINRLSFQIWKQPNPLYSYINYSIKKDFMKLKFSNLNIPIKRLINWQLYLFTRGLRLYKFSHLKICILPFHSTSLFYLRVCDCVSSPSSPFFIFFSLPPHRRRFSPLSMNVGPKKQTDWSSSKGSSSKSAFSSNKTDGPTSPLPLLPPPPSPPPHLYYATTIHL